jgi:NitT/TauT family transport system substrate-binding protein
MNARRTILSRRSVVSLLGAALLESVAAPPVRAQQATVIRLGSAFADDLTPAIYAIYTGAFKQAGLDVQVQIAQNGAALAAAVVGGAVDVAKSTLMALIAGYTHGVFFKIIAGAAVYDAKKPTGELVTARESTIKTATDMNGKIIATTTLETLDHLVTLLYVDQNGGDSASLKFVEMPYTAMLPALESGHADIASLANPVMQTVLESGKVKMLADQYRSLGTRYMIAAWFCSRDYAARNPGPVSRFAQVLRAAATYTNAHPQETAAMVADYMRVDLAVVTRMNRMESAVGINPGELQKLVDLAYRYKFIDKTLSAKELIAAS